MRSNDFILQIERATTPTNLSVDERSAIIKLATALMIISIIELANNDHFPGGDFKFYKLGILLVVALSSAIIDLLQLTHFQPRQQDRFFESFVDLEMGLTTLNRPTVNGVF